MLGVGGGMLFSYRGGDRQDVRGWFSRCRLEEWRGA